MTTINDLYEYASVANLIVAQRARAGGVTIGFWTYTPEYLAINPLGRVPALRDGNFTLHESLAIMVYLDRKQLSPPLFGRTAEDAGRIFQGISEFISDFGPSNQRLGRSIFFGPPLGAAEAKEVREKIHLSQRLDGRPGPHGLRYRRLSGPEALAAGVAGAPRSSSIGAGA